MTLSKENEILIELRRISKFLASMATKDLSNTDKVFMLTDLGLNPTEISELTGINRNTVGVILHRRKPKKKKKNERKIKGVGTADAAKDK